MAVRIVVVAFIIAPHIRGIPVPTPDSSFRGQALGQTSTLIDLSSGSRSTSHNSIEAEQIVCDTDYQCKMKVAKNKMTCCKVCRQALHVVGEDPYYGFYEFLEQDPNGKSEKIVPTNRAVALFRKNQRDKYPKMQLQQAKAAKKKPSEIIKEMGTIQDPSLMAALEACPLPIEDDFKLPCCMPCVGAFNPQKDPKKPDTMPIVENPPIEVNGRKGVPTGPVMVSNQIQKEDKSFEFNGPAEVPCCASRESCCRWCSKTTCPRLELTNDYIDELFWALCSDVDEGRRLAKDNKLAQETYYRKLVEDKDFWNPMK
jgi:hypothetical protein